MSTFKRTILPAIISVVAIAIMYYAMIPAINIKNPDFWWFLVYAIIIVFVLFGLPRLGEAGTNFFDDLRTNGPSAFTSRGSDAKEKRKELRRKPLFWVAALAVFLILGCFVGQIASSAFFNAKAYSSLLEVQDGDFATDISEISMKSVPVVDRDTAVRLGSRTIGEMSDLVSQYTVDESSSAYTQINYKEAPYRVSPLVYADIIKWITNTGAGLPGYVTVNMVTQETKLVRLSEGQYMHYSTAEHFNNYLYRHVRFAYPTEMFGEASFEIDEQGTPYWIVPTMEKRIGLFGGDDYSGAILVNACTGEMVKCEAGEIPQWCDKVFNAALVYDQLSYYGKYQSGFWNSVIGQSGVLVPTGSDALGLFSSNASDTASTQSGGYNYLAINDDVYMYTGMTSANSDESLVGFTLVNLRTKSTHYYVCSGATEGSAMDSAEGQVQQMSYNATSPLLLNIADRPTYFLSLKDAAGLVKMYAFIDVQQYQIVGTGSTIDQAQKNYVTALGSDDQVDVDTSKIATDDDTTPKVTGKISSIQSVVIEGTSFYYFMIEGDDKHIYTANINLSKKLPFYKTGSTITVTYADAENDVREVNGIK